MSDRSTSKKKDHRFPSTTIKRHRSRAPVVETLMQETKTFPLIKEESLEKGGEMKCKSTCLPVLKG